MKELEIKLINRLETAMRCHCKLAAKALGSATHGWRCTRLKWWIKIEKLYKQNRIIRI